MDDWLECERCGAEVPEDELQYSPRADAELCTVCFALLEN